MQALEISSLILRVAFRNLWLYRLKSIVIASLLGIGSFISIVGLSLLRDVEGTMQDSIIGSVAGHLQMYSNKAKDDLAIFGSTFMGRQDIGVLEDVAIYREAVLAHPAVEAVIPMGIDMGILGRGNEMDDGLDALRAALKSQDSVIVEERMEQLKFQLEQLGRELKERRRIAQDQEELIKESNDLTRAGEAEFLAQVAQGQEDALQFLETKIAPMSGEKLPIYLMYLGTDIALFKENFPKFHVVKGEALPPGQRGILLSNKIREDQLKNIAARLFDKLHKRTVKLRIPIEDDPENQRLVQDLPRQYGQIMAYLDRSEATDLHERLLALGIRGEGENLIAQLALQIKQFLTVDDTNFKERHAWFYAHVAPKIKLYEISPGETILLRSYTKSGYIKSLPLKVYGVYSFQGLEDSEIAGVMNIIDLVSLRELYGQMTETSLKELQEMRAQVGIKEVAAENAEDALFGEAASATVENRIAAPVGGQETIQIKPVIPDVFDLSEVTQGLALNAAIKLKDASQLDTVKEQIEANLKSKGLDIKIVDWKQATGIIGQFVVGVRLILIFALVVIFIVTLVIINNSIIVGTLNRIREIGTMRAIGAQKSFVVGMFLAETAITGLIGSLIGTALAVGLLVWLGAEGIPSKNDIVTFFFSGPRLYPQLHPAIIIASPLFVTAIATLASVYAARHAAHVTPAEAMQEKE